MGTRSVVRHVRLDGSLQRPHLGAAEAPVAAMIAERAPVDLVEGAAGVGLLTGAENRVPIFQLLALELYSAEDVCRLPAGV